VRRLGRRRAGRSGLGRGRRAASVCTCSCLAGALAVRRACVQCIRPGMPLTRPAPPWGETALGAVPLRVASRSAALHWPGMPLTRPAPLRGETALGAVPPRAALRSAALHWPGMPLTRPAPLRGETALGAVPPWVALRSAGSVRTRHSSSFHIVAFFLRVLRPVKLRGNSRGTLRET